MKDLETESLKTLELQFMEEWYQGKKPDIAAYAAKYPQFADQLAEFVLLFAISEDSVVPESGVVNAQTSAAVERGLKASASRARTLVGRLGECDIAPDDLSARLSVPTAIVMWLNQRVLMEIPRAFVAALARELNQSTVQILDLIRPPKSRAVPARSYRATSQPQAQAAELRTFRDALLHCHRSQLATDEQVSKWLKRAE